RGKVRRGVGVRAFAKLQGNMFTLRLATTRCRPIALKNWSRLLMPIRSVIWPIAILSLSTKWATRRWIGGLQHPVSQGAAAIFSPALILGRLLLTACYIS